MRKIAPIILLTDADILSRHAIAYNLRANGHTVFEAANLKEAQIVIRQFPRRIELVLCDETKLVESGISELIRCADSASLLVNLRFLAGFEAVVRAAVALSNNGNTSQEKQDFDLLVSYILYVKAKQSNNTSN